MKEISTKTTKFKCFTRLSKDLGKFYEMGINHDIAIIVDNGKSTKEFKAHSVMLCARSSYFATEIWGGKEGAGSSNNSYGYYYNGNNGNGRKPLFYMKLNISPDTFEKILRYIYTGEIELKGLELSDILDLLSTADELLLDELIELIGAYLIKNESKYLRDKVSVVLQLAAKLKLCDELKKNLLEMNSRNPVRYLKSDYSPSLEHSTLHILSPQPQISSLYIDDHAISWIESHIGSKEVRNVKSCKMKYHWELIYRASVDGCSASNFHQCCDERGECVVVAQISGEDADIVGGYNPVGWYKSVGEYSRCDRSFIFNFNKNLSIKRLSRVMTSEKAIYQCSETGPSFGADDFMIGDNLKDSKCNINYYYEDTIDLGYIEVEDYEVFKITRKQ